MKQLLMIALLAITCTANAQLGIGTSAAAASAQLDITSTTKGFLPPRMTGAQRDLIGSAATGLLIYCTNCGAGEPEYYNGSNWVNMAGGTAAVVVPSVTSSTGRIWMDRNLGASQVATSSTDAAAYGDLYQWGRGTDGHQSRTSGITSNLSSSDQPGNSNFITTSGGNYDWRSPQNDFLWQGVSGVNNPCPAGYRLPTKTEFDSEIATWGSSNAAGAFGSVLKIPMAGTRNHDDGLMNYLGILSYYWTSTINASFSNTLFISSSSGYVNILRRAYGASVRCIKN